MDEGISSAVPAAGQGAVARLAAYFGARSSYWDDVYAEGSLDGVIYRERMAVSLAWVDELDARPAARALDVGCGAGLATVALASRGYAVDAIDVAEEMLARTRARALACGALDRVRVVRADIDALERSPTYDLVLGLGLLPWLSRPQATVQTLAGLLRPGGHLLVTADSRWCLSHLVDPWRNPLTRRPAWLAHRLFLQLRGVPRPSAARTTPPASRHSAREVDRWIASAGLEKRRSASVGFGPFTCFDHDLIPMPAAVRLHASLQGLASKRVPYLENAGAHYLVLARKPLQPQGAGGGAQRRRRRTP